MTISNTNRKAGPYVGNDAAKDFPFSFKVFSAADLVVILADSLGTEITLVIDSDYTVALNADQDTDPGGTVSLPEPLASDYSLTVASDIPYMQPLELTNQGGFYPKVLNAALDRLTIFAQQLAEQMGRALKYSISSPLGDSALPPPVPNYVIGWNSSGNGFENYAPSDNSLLSAALAAPAGAAQIGFVSYGPIDGDTVQEVLELAAAFIQAGEGAVTRRMRDKARESVSAADFGAVGDGVTDNADALQNADALGGTILFPGDGTYYSTYTPTSPIYTNGKAKITLGGATFQLATIPAPISAIEQTEVDETAVRLNNLSIGVDAGINLQSTADSYGNTALGTSALQNAEQVKRCTAIGPYALRDGIDLYSMIAIGTTACEYTAYGNRCVLIGDNAGKNLGSNNVSERHGYYLSAGSSVPSEWASRWPAWRDYAGTVEAPAFVAVNQESANRCVGIGRNTLGYSIVAKTSVAIGYDAGTSSLAGESNTFIGDRSGQWTLKGSNVTAVGAETMRAVMDANQDVAIGRQALYNYVHTTQNVGIGYQALGGLLSAVTDTPSNNIAIGRIAMANCTGSISNNVGIGGSALIVNSGNDNTAVGHNALLRKTTGNQNTAIGRNSLILMSDGSTNATTLNNCTGVGYDTRVSGDNQVQIGNASTTTYVYGTVQNRSDERDKADIRDTALGLDFINALRPVDYKWDMRDDYVMVDEDGNATKIERDGSKKRNRFHHGLIAQDVQALIAQTGIDFGGFQDHSVNGGCDVMTIGYDELIAPLIKAVQQLSARVEQLENNLSQ